MDSRLQFNESEWIRLLFLLADTQTWIDDMAKQAFSQVPMAGKKKFLRKTYFLTATATAHIIERHYYKINRYPHAGKFHIPLIEILHHIREAHAVPVTPLPGCLNFQRTLQTNNIIGHDKDGQPVNNITILTDGGGKIITAFPGAYKDPSVENAAINKIAEADLEQV